MSKALKVLGAQDSTTQTPQASGDSELTLIKKRHEKFLLRFLDILPGDRFASLETSRMTILFFAISGLDVLGSLEKSLNEERKREIVDWIYSLQVEAGFLGSTFLKIPKLEDKLCDSVHIAMTYTALATLVILGDDLSRINRKGVLQGLKSLQKPDGSFMASKEEQGCDMRFVYCAASICTFVNSFDGIDTEKMVEYILKSQTYEGAFGQSPGLEAHGGSTYCALAALSMLGKLENLDQRVKDKCQKWCCLRLNEGFNGRPNKQDDTCYTYWIGGALKLLSPTENFANDQVLHCVKYVLSTQDSITGGLAKWPENQPDPMHTYLGLAGLSIASYSDLRPIDPELNITKRARAFLTRSRS